MTNGLFPLVGFQSVNSKYPSHKSGQPKQPPAADVYASIVKAQQEAQPFTYPSGLVEIPMSLVKSAGDNAAIVPLGDFVTRAGKVE